MNWKNIICLRFDARRSPIPTRQPCVFDTKMTMGQIDVAAIEAAGKG